MSENPTDRTFSTLERIRQVLTELGGGGDAPRGIGIAKQWRLHDLRHFSATMATAAGDDARTVAHRLGHADPTMTLRVYARVVEAADQGIAKLPGGALQGGS